MAEARAQGEMEESSSHWLASDVRELHQSLFRQMRLIVDRITHTITVPAAPILELLNEVVTSFIKTPDQWMGLAHLATPEPFLQTHSTNVTIFSLALGRGRSYPEPRLHTLATKAYLHDLGMLNHINLIDVPRRLTDDEVDQLRQHPHETAQMIERFIPDMDRAVSRAIVQDHERLDGSGYPHRLHDSQIEDDMRIIGIADVYEALTHQRSWRNRLTPRQAIEQLLGPNMEPRFDADILRLLVTNIGIYPVGSWVSFSTGESGRVLKMNAKAPLRPTVEVLTDAEGEPLSHPRVVDTTQYPTFFIKECAGYEPPN